MEPVEPMELVGPAIFGARQCRTFHMKPGYEAESSTT